MCAMCVYITLDPRAPTTCDQIEVLARRSSAIVAPVLYRIPHVRCSKLVRGAWRRLRGPPLGFGKRHIVSHRFQNRMTSTALRVALTV